MKDLSHSLANLSHARNVFIDKDPLTDAKAPYLSTRDLSASVAIVVLLLVGR